MSATFTICVPTIGRPSLRWTLESIARQPLRGQDRVVVALDTYNEPPRPDVAELVESFGFELLPVNGGHHFFGNPQLTAAIAACTTDYFCALGDDDIYVDGALERLRPACDGRAVLFQFYAPPYLVEGNSRRFILWAERKLQVANLSGCCIAAPRNALVPVSEDRRIEVDFDWIAAIVEKTGRKPRWLQDVLVIARPEMRDGQPLHKGVGKCPTCGFEGFLEDFCGRVCEDCAPVVLVA